MKEIKQLERNEFNLRILVNAFAEGQNVRFTRQNYLHPSQRSNFLSSFGLNTLEGAKRSS